ncbi:MAG: nucleotide-diphospho-sugar transferase [Flavobacteriia bacterium]
MIDWECEVHTNFREENAGCGKNVSEAITWFFEHVEEGIILEDDCIPNESFFQFCEVMLDRYREVEQVFMVGGNNFQNKPHTTNSYYFSVYGHIWGWATWRRAWKNYRFQLNEYDSKLMRSSLKRNFKNIQIFDYWWNIFKQMNLDPIDTWDYQWSFCQWYFNGLSITPTINLVKNIGFGADATHTKEFVEGIFQRDTFQLDKIQHPLIIKRSNKPDKSSFFTMFQQKNRTYLILKSKEKLYHLLRNQKIVNK